MNKIQWLKDGQENPQVWPYAVKDQHCSATLKINLIKGDEIINVVYARNSVSAGGNEGQGHATVDLTSHAENDWDKIRVELDLSIKGGAETLAEVITNNNAAEAFFSVRIHAPRVKYRQHLWGKPAQALQDMVIFEVYKKDLGGDVYIWPEILLKNNVEAALNRASRAGSRIVIGDPVLIALDDAPQIPGAGFDIKWLEFERQNKNALYKLEYENPDTGRPRLYFNNRYPLIQPIIDSTARKGIKARIRDLIFSSVAVDVWSGLLEWALERDDEDAASSGIHSNIIRSLSKRLNINKDDLKSQILTAEGRRNIKTSLQHTLDISEKINRAAEEASFGGE